MKLLRFAALAVLAVAVVACGDSDDPTTLTEGDELTAAANLLTGRYLDAEYHPEDHPGYLQMVDRLLGTDLD